MRNNLKALSDFRVFLNYPFDEEFEPLAHAMHFAVVATGLIPTCARDVSAPDRLRLEMLVDIISNSRFSVHDFSRYRGEGEKNFARFNMPIEMGMSLYYAFSTYQREHRCAFFVDTPHDYQRFASDLAGLDPKHHDNKDLLMLTGIYEWLREVGEGDDNMIPTVEVQEQFRRFLKELERVNGSGENGRPTHNESQELMYKMCSECGWWHWRDRDNKFKSSFPVWPLSWKP
jgi:hypothetical protein